MNDCDELRLLRQIYDQAYMATYVSFGGFRSAPADWLLVTGQYDAVAIMASGYRPLLPIQVRLRQDLEAQWRKEGVWDESMRLLPPDPEEIFRVGSN